MGIYDGLPYELQSPRWRNAGNHVAGSTEWNPSLNSDWTARMLDASVQVAQAQANGVNTAQVDGASGFLGNLSGFAGALLQSIGGRPETAPAPVVTQAGYGGGGGIDMQTILMVAAVGAGLYFVTK